jgi:hypothetical protein
MSFKRMNSVALVFVIILFLLQGYKILTGEFRGDVRVSLGFFGWLVTFISIFGFPALLSISTVYFFSYPSVMKDTKRDYINIISLAFFAAIMLGGKSNVVFMFFPLLLQMAHKIKVKYWVFIIALGILSVIVIGMSQMGMSFSESFSYNVYRATDLAAYGTICTWDYLPRGADNPFFSLYTVFGEKLTSILTSVDRHSIDFFKYSLTRQITYLYYGDYDAAITGTGNLTLTSFADAVYWFGRKYCYLMLIPVSIFTYQLTLRVFKTMRLSTIRENTLYTVYFTTIYLSWLNGGGGNIGSLFGLTTIFYFLLTYWLTNYICCK